tara:strand:- start:265 stop:459 length:195 start_codon:yes stop_codon:yes gene_type:complete
MKQQMTSKQLRELKERQRGILRGEIKPRSKSLQLATEEEWAALGLSGERVYTSFNPLGNNPRQK